jgi:hypothetical protein
LIPISIRSRRAALAVIGMCLSGLCLSLGAQTQRKTEPKTVPDAAQHPATQSEDAQLYRNATYGFRFRIPYGWVDRTGEMNRQDDRTDANGDVSPPAPSSAPPAKQTPDKPAPGGKAEVLLGVFERPPEASAEAINSGVVIAAESAESYPGLKRAEDYVGPLTEVATANGFKSAGDPVALEVESRRLVRADFIKTINDNLTMRQCTLILLMKRRIVSFTFIAESEEALDDIMDGLHFGATKASGR